MFINQILAKLKSSVYSKSETDSLLNSKGFITSEIDSMGEGWVRFKSGLQICYGIAVNNNNVATGVTRHSFPVAFRRYPEVVAIPGALAEFNIYTITLSVENGTTFIINSWANYVTPPVLTVCDLGCYYIAIGKWE